MISIEAPAKINLFLAVHGKRDDGFHALTTLFCEIDLHDTLHWQPGTAPLTLEVRGADLGDPEENLVMRAARAYHAAGGDPIGGHLLLEKRIPAGGGLGGGSSDAAAALRLFERGASAPLGEARLHQIAAALGSDVPFFLIGGCCLGEGRGEVLRRHPLPEIPRRGLLILPGIHIATGPVFGRLAEMGAYSDRQNLPAIGHNDLLAPALALSPRFAEHHRRLHERLGDSLFMTGSGSTLVWLSEHASPESIADLTGGLRTERFVLRAEQTQP